MVPNTSRTVERYSSQQSPKMQLLLSSASYPPLCKPDFLLKHCSFQWFYSLLFIAKISLVPKPMNSNSLPDMDEDNVSKKVHIGGTPINRKLGNKHVNRLHTNLIIELP